MLDRMPDRMPDRLSARISAYMLDRMPEYIQAISKYMSCYVLTCHGGDHSKKSN